MDLSLDDGADLLPWGGRLIEEWGATAVSRAAVARTLWRRLLALFALTRSAARSLSKAVWSKRPTSWSTDELTRCRSSYVTASLEEASVAPTVVAISIWSKRVS